jgi:very-short-patch-repair endonuclease
MPDTNPKFLSALERSRKELLDLSLRNPLLKFRISSKRGLSIIDENADQVFDALVRSKMTLKFHHTMEGGEARKRRGRKPKDETLNLVPAEPTPLVRVGMGEENREDSLATPYSAEEMQERLLATWRDAELALQERGANFLNAAIGHLEWYEADNSDVMLRAPLILVPVRLERSGVRGKFTLRATEEDPCLNIALAEKLKEFDVRLPPLPENADEIGVTGYLDEIARSVRGQKRWKVDTHSMAIGFFSFGKFLMYRDLDPDIWPEWCHPGTHEILTGLLTEGMRPEAVAVSAQDDLDEVVPPGETMEVVDCDGSQAEALAEVAYGQNLIVQGPPGTGKSQTITNMIAQAVHEGKSVLFIAEKMAALDVVKRRLDSVGLGELCLELHSDKANKKAIVEQLKTAMNSGRPRIVESGTGPQLADSRKDLNGYTKALHETFRNSGLSPYKAFSTSEKIRAAFPQLPEFGQKALADYSQAQYRSLRSLGGDLADCIRKTVGTPSKHPFAEVGLTEVLPGADADIGQKLMDAKASLDEALAAMRALAGDADLPVPETIEGSLAMDSLSGHILASPKLEGVPPLAGHWDGETSRELESVVEKGVAHRRMLAEYDAKVRPKGWGADLEDAREDVSLYVGKPFRLFSGKYRKAANQIKACARAPLPKGPAQLIEFTEVIAKEKTLRSEIEAAAETGKRFLGSQWKGADSDWSGASSILAWAKTYRTIRKKGPWPDSLDSRVVQPYPASMAQKRDQGSRSVSKWISIKQQLSDAIRIVEAEQAGLQSFAKAGGNVSKWSENISRLPEYTYCRRLLDSLMQMGFPEMAQLIYEGTLPPDAIVPAIDWNFATAVSRRSISERPQLRDFHIDAHSSVRERFRKADKDVFAHNRSRLARKHWESLPPISGIGQMGYLQEEFNRKRLRPIRKLMENAGDAVQAIKPVFMMSPLSIAAYLPTTGPRFDLAIFDEASQVKPVDSFGAILRADQIVVVGDDKQMPPTAFFDRMTDQGDLEDEEEQATLPDVESILGLCKARGMRDKMLKWHYRSQHESLIAVSNQEFYRDLVVFPSPRKHQDGLGLRFHHLAHTVYDKGGTRTNAKEAEAVGLAVLDHARRFPENTLGVVAFSMAQKAAIQAVLEKLAQEHPELDEFISRSHPEEEFFVKNLENVQGDERDFIFISIGYGRDAEGRVGVSFGPVNSQGGERRLNVLISRARKSCQVFSNIRGEDIDLSRTNSEGVRVLRTFLSYAETGKMDATSNTGREADSEFEIEVAKLVQSMGYRVQPQVGCGTYRIDIGVLDDQVEGRYIAGIECDGAAYHSARWARDRDRLREGWLRKQGWNIIRIWSTDWYRQRPQAIARLKRQLEEAKAGQAQAPREEETVRFSREEDAPRKENPGFPKYVYAKLPPARNADFDSLGQSQLMEWTRMVIQEQYPVHKDEVFRRIADHLEQRITDSRIERLNQALAGLVHKGEIVPDGEHFLPKVSAPTRARDRSGHTEFRKIEFLHEGELRHALAWIIRHSFGCSAEDAQSQTLRFLGVIRGDEASNRIGDVLKRMRADGEILERGGHLRMKA